MKCYFIGEYHGGIANLQLELTYLNFLHINNIFPKYLLFEGGPTYGYICNKYFATGNDYLLDLVEPLESRKKILRDLRKYWNTLSDKKKFYFVGIDYEDHEDQTHYMLRDILLEGLKINDRDLFEKINQCNNFLNSENSFWNLLASFKIKENPTLWSKKNLLEDINGISSTLKSSDSSMLITILGTRVNEVRSLLKSFEAPLKNKEIYLNKNRVNRDKYIATNVYNVFLLDTNVTILGQLGMAHIPKTPQSKWSDGEATSAIYFLNNDTVFKKLNNRVNTNAIIYKTFPIKKYNYLQLLKSDSKKIFSEMERKNCKVYFRKFQDSTIIDNLIYLDNTR